MKTIKELERVYKTIKNERHKFFLRTKLQTLKDVLKLVDGLNERFRKDNMPQRLSGDEFNDLWEEELKKEIEGEDANHDLNEKEKGK